jgi:nucleotide-binding universal stress UspA family protein
MKTFKHILVPTDFSAASVVATETAMALASAFGAELTLLHVWEIPVYPYLEFVLSSAELVNEVEQAAGKRLDHELERVRKELPRARSSLSMGFPWQIILDSSKELSADLIVMGTHGRHGLNHVLLGSVAERVVRFSEAPVLTVHPAKAG